MAPNNGVTILPRTCNHCKRSCCNDSCKTNAEGEFCSVDMISLNWKSKKFRRCRKRTEFLWSKLIFLFSVIGVCFIYYNFKPGAGSLAPPVGAGRSFLSRHILQLSENSNNDFPVNNAEQPDNANQTLESPEEEKNCTPPSIHEFPQDLFTDEQRLQGALVIHFFVSFYMFVALAIVCDDYFVPSLEQISEKLKLTEDVAGATFMAAGSSAPELFTSIIGVFVAEGDVGVGTIVGSAVFNILVIIGLCALCCDEAVPLHWWPLMRDSSYYGLAVAVLIGVIHDGWVSWYESLIMLVLYVGYIIVMKFNGKLEKLLKAAREKTVKRLRRKTPKKEENGKCSREDLSLSSMEKKDDAETAMMMPKSSNEKASDPPAEEPQRRAPATNGRVVDADEGAGAALLSKPNGNTSPAPPAEGTPEHKKPKGICASQNGTSVVVQLAPRPPTMVPIDEVISTGSRPLGFEEAGLRVMMSNTFAPKTRLRMACKILINERKNLVVQKNESDGAPERVLIRRKTDMSLEGISSTPAISERCTSDTLEDVKSVSVAADDDDGLSYTHPFVVPRDSWVRFSKWLLCWPISFCFFVTIPNCSKKRWEKWFIVSFIVSTCWIMGCSYIMVWMGTVCGYTLQIPDSIMGISFLAAGTSVPDTIASVIVARQGLGDMAVSNSIGSNVFDILLGLALPWFLKTAVVSSGTMVQINSNGLLWSVFLLLASLFFVIISIHVNGWKLTRNLGILIMLMYCAFLTLSILIEFNVFFPVNLPMCRD